MKIRTKIISGFSGLTLLTLACATVGYYGVSRLSNSVTFISGPTWDTADGAMEVAIEVEAQVIAINDVLINQHTLQEGIEEIEDSRSKIGEELRMIRDGGLLDLAEVEKVEDKRQEYDRMSEVLLERYTDFTAADLVLGEHFFAFQQLMFSAEELGDAQVDVLRNNPDQSTTWNTGLEERWVTADSTMMSQTGILQRIYFYERLTSNKDEAESLKGLDDARVYLQGHLDNILDKPVFKLNRVPDRNYNGATYSQAIISSIAEQDDDFDNAVKTFQLYQDALSEYSEITRELLEYISQFQVESEAIAEAELVKVDSVINSSYMFIIVVVVFSLILSVAAGYFIVTSIRKPLAEALVFAEEFASGNLRSSMKINFKDEVGQVLESLKSMQGKMINVISGIRTGSTEVATASEQVSQGNTNLSQRTQEQASALEEVASSIEEITSAVDQNAENAQQANQLALASREQAEKGGDVVGRTVVAMNEINTSSKKIEDIIVVIDEIAFQTNLLALNAAVEAARAGEQGRGFAVVASEVRNLAGRSATAAKEIKTLIQDSVNKVEGGTKLIDESGQVLGEIVTSVKKVSDIVSEIASASEEQSEGIEQVNKAIAQMDSMTQHNASLVEEAEAASEALGAQAQELNASVAFFQINGSGDDIRTGRVQQALPVRNSNGNQPTMEHQPKVGMLQVQQEDKTDDSNWKEF